LTFNSAEVPPELAEFGVVVSSSENEAILDVPRDKVAATASAVLNRYSIADLAIEDVDIEEVVRTLFTRKR
jgi:ABC-type uncharacterized transport system ATPase subunit